MTSTVNPGFSGRPFAAGVVTGLRSWNAAGALPWDVPPQFVHGGGMLTARVQRSPWVDGENVGRCLDGPLDEPHRVAAKDCSCGFYGYFDGQVNAYAYGESVISGIVEGYGIVTVGPLGFRAEKARIVALVRVLGAPLLNASLERRYPSVEFYDTLEEAVAAHPLTKPGDVGVEEMSLAAYNAALTNAVNASFARFSVSMRGVGRAAALAGYRWQRLAYAAGTPPTLYIVDPKGNPGNPGGLVARRGAAPALSVIDEHLDPRNAVARKRAAAEAAAAARTKAGLRGVGGIDRRRRKP